jgi:hypothetical protein
MAGRRDRGREVSNFASEFKEHIRSGPGPHGRYDIFFFAAQRPALVGGYCLYDQLTGPTCLH